MGKNVGLFCFLLSRVFLLLEINSLFPIDCHFRFNPSTAEGIGGTRSFQRGISRNSTRLDWRRNGWWYWFQKRCTRTTDKNNNSWSGSTKLFTGYPKWIRGNFKELPTCLDFGFFHLREKIMLVILKSKSLFLKKNVPKSIMNTVYVCSNFKPQKCCYKKPMSLFRLWCLCMVLLIFLWCNVSITSK